MDPRRETADTDRTNNHFPSRMEDKSFELKPREERKNPMRAWLKGERRKAVRQRVESLSKMLMAAWDRKQAPAANAATLREKVAAGEFANDAWGRPFHIEFSRALPEAGKEKETRFAAIHSDGPDKKPETDDDVNFVLFRDGRLAAR